MGQRQLGRVAPFFVVKQQVDVQRARAVFAGAHPPAGGFDAERRPEQRGGGEACCDPHGGVEKEPLRPLADGFGLENAGAGDDAGAGQDVEGGDAAPQKGEPVAEVGAQREVGGVRRVHASSTTSVAT